MNQTGMNASHMDVRSAIISTAMNMNPTKATSSSASVTHQFSSGVRYTYVTLMIVILIVTIIANIVLIAVICYHKKLHTTTNIFIANLALGDTIMALAVVPFDIDQLLRGYFAFDERVCEISNTVFFLSLAASTLNLSILTLERFCAIRFPLMHRTGRIFTARRNLIILVCSWVYISVTACLPVMGWRRYPTVVVDGQCLFFFETEYALFQLCGNFIFPLVFIVVMNVWILYIARKGLNSSVLSRKSSSQSVLRKVSGTGSNGKGKLPKRQLSKQISSSTQEANKKAAKIIAILVGVFAFCWLPYIVNIAVNIICKGCSPQEVTAATMILVFFNSVTNPILYGIYKPQIRSSLKEVCAKITNKMCRNAVKKRPEAQPLDKEIELTCV